MTPSQAKRKPKKYSKRAKRDRYDTYSYRRAITYGIEQANKKRNEQEQPQVPYWCPLQIRHSRATEVRKQHGLEAAQVLLSDFELWHYVLNYGYLPKTEKEGEAFENELTAAGLSLTGCSLRTPLPHARYRQSIEQSWERIFDLTWTDPEHAIVSRTKNRCIQGTMWELRLDEVVDSKEFTAR
jgi:hypothetical protein